MLSLADSKPEFGDCGRRGHPTQLSLSALLTRPKVERVLMGRQPQGRGDRRGIPRESETSAPQLFKGNNEKGEP